MSKELKPLTPEELRLAGRLLAMTSGMFANHSCNDMDEDVWGDLSKEKRRDLSQQYHDWNGDPEEGGHEDMEDWLLMRLLAEKLKAS